MSVAWFVVLQEDIEDFDHDCTLTALCRAMEEVQEIATQHGVSDLTAFAKFDEDILDDDAEPLFEDEDAEDEWPDADDDDDSDDDGFRSFDDEDEEFIDDDEDEDDDDEDTEGPWYDPAEALLTVNVLLDHYREQRNALMVEELELLRRILEKARVNSVRFNLQMDY